MANRLDKDVPLPVLVERAVQEDPYLALAAATGVGFLVGGGLGGRLLGSSLEAAGRVAGALLLSYVFAEKPDERQGEDISARDSRVRARPPS